MTEKRLKYLETKARKEAERLNYPRHYVLVTNDSEKATKYGYTKLVSNRKAFEMINGRLNEFGQRILKLKHIWREA